MKKIKYCALTTTASSLKSFVLPSLDYLSEHGYEVTVSCAEDKNFRRDMDAKYPYFSLDIARGFHLAKTVQTTISLYHFFQQESFDMIEYGTENVALCAAIAGFCAGVPVRIYNHWGARYVGLSGFFRFLSIWIERMAALFSTDIRQVSRRNTEMCVKQHLYPARKVKVLGKGGTIGVDITIFNCSKKQQYRKEIFEEYGLPSDAFLFGFVGRIQKDKGINELIQAFKKLKNNSQAYLILVGNIDDQNPIRQENMDWAHNSDHVIFTGPVNDVYRYMSAMDTLVHPTYREGFGMVLQEAAAVKTPIITTDIMGPGEFIQDGETGVLVKPKNEDQLYEAMHLIISDSKLRNRLAEKGYNYVCENFERSVMLQGILDDRELLARKVK